MLKSMLPLSTAPFSKFLFHGNVKQTRKLKELLEETLGWEFQQKSAVDGLYFEEGDEVSLPFSLVGNPCNWLIMIQISCMTCISACLTFHLVSKPLVCSNFSSSPQHLHRPKNEKTQKWMSLCASSKWYTNLSASLPFHDIFEQYAPVVEMLEDTN